MVAVTNRTGEFGGAVSAAVIVCTVVAVWTLVCPCRTTVVGVAVVTVLTCGGGGGAVVDPGPLAPAAPALDLAVGAAPTVGQSSPKTPRIQYRFGSFEILQRHH